MRSYNLFRLKGREGMCCAVPEDYAIPAFLSGQRWAFGGKLSGTDSQLGFDDRAADAGVRYNGFYLFQSFERSARGSRSADDGGIR